MGKEFDYLVFIGRFQPFHNGHKRVIEEAFRRAEKVIVLLGSSGIPRSPRNPFTAEERSALIYRSMTDNYRTSVTNKLFVKPVEDHPYNEDAWIQSIQQAVDDVTWQFKTTQEPKIGLIGYAKDSSSYYLSLFPQWGEFVEVEQEVIFNSTDIRSNFLTSAPTLPGTHIVPAPVHEFLANFVPTPEFASLVAEKAYIDEYKKSWEGSPYPPTFVTADAVVVQSGHVLLIERKANPGKGLLALPGGFLDPDDKSLLDSAIRELREETKLKVPEPVLKGSISRREVFDNPYRSERGRIITHAFLFDLKDRAELPKVQGASDAGRAFWSQISHVSAENMFEDHYAILRTMLGLG